MWTDSSLQDWRLRNYHLSWTLHLKAGISHEIARNNFYEKPLHLVFWNLSRCIMKCWKNGNTSGKAKKPSANIKNRLTLCSFCNNIDIWRKSLCNSICKIALGHSVGPGAQYGLKHHSHDFSSLPLWNASVNRSYKQQIRLLSWPM